MLMKKKQLKKNEKKGKKAMNYNHDGEQKEHLK